MSIRKRKPEPVHVGRLLELLFLVPELEVCIDFTRVPELFYERLSPLIHTGAEAGSLEMVWHANLLQSSVRCGPSTVGTAADEYMVSNSTYIPSSEVWLCNELSSQLKDSLVVEYSKRGDIPNTLGFAASVHDALRSLIQGKFGL